MTTVFGVVPGATRKVQMIARLVDDLGRPIRSPDVTTTRRFYTLADGSWRLDLPASELGQLWVIARRGDRVRAYLRVPEHDEPVEASTILVRTGEGIVVDRQADADAAAVIAARAAAAASEARAIAAEERAASAVAAVELLAARVAKIEAVPSVAAGLAH